MSLLLDWPMVWTFEDLQKLPDDTPWHSYEIVDGALVVSPAPSGRHEYVNAFLRRALVRALPPDMIEVTTLGISLDRSYRIPDLLVAPRRVIAAATGPLSPADVALAVEIVSAGSVTTGRTTKPAQYAAAEIGAYRRVETDPHVTLTAYTLPAGASTYSAIGTFGPGETAQIDDPFPVRVPIDLLSPAP